MDGPVFVDFRLHAQYLLMDGPVFVDLRLQARTTGLELFKLQRPVLQQSSHFHQSVIQCHYLRAPLL
jgi:hypothetical protein